MMEMLKWGVAAVLLTLKTPGFDRRGIPEFLSTEHATGTGFSFGPLGIVLATHVLRSSASNYRARTRPRRHGQCAVAGRA